MRVSHGRPPSATGYGLRAFSRYGSAGGVAVAFERIRTLMEVDMVAAADGALLSIRPIGGEDEPRTVVVPAIYDMQEDGAEEDASTLLQTPEVCHLRCPVHPRHNAVN